LIWGKQAPAVWRVDSLPKGRAMRGITTGLEEAFSVKREHSWQYRSL